MSGITEKVKDFIAEAIVHYREIDFQQNRRTTTYFENTFTQGRLPHLSKEHLLC